MGDMREWIARRERFYAKTGDVADAIQKRDARIMDVEYGTQLEWAGDMACFRATVYSDRHKREAVVTTSISEELIVDSEWDAVGYLSTVILEAFEWQEAHP